MRMVDVLKEAVSLLSEVPDGGHVTAAWAGRRAALLLTEIEDNDGPAEGPLTDERWHQYAIAALRTCGVGLSAWSASVFATEVADRMLEAANRQAQTGKGAA